MIKFGLTGVINTVIGLGIIFALKAWFGFSDTAANLTGYCVGFAVSCVLNARWTFQYREALAPIVPGYALVVLIAYLANLACVHFCIDVLKINSYVAQAAGVAPYALLTYFLSRRFVFRAKP